MADLEPLPGISRLKDSEILVHVEEAVLDFLVVSYEYDSRLYQGVLLNATKRPLPCGLLTPSGFPESDSVQHGLGADEDKLHSVAQRYSYFQGKSPPHLSSTIKDSSSPGSAYHMRRAMRGGQSKFKNSRMTVRLRPRQVLCSKCKSICNENSENVDLSRKRKGEESAITPNGTVEKRSCPSRQISPKSPRPPFSENPQDNKASINSAITRRKNASSPSVNTSSFHVTLIPKTVKESDSPNTLNCNVNKLNLVEDFWMREPNDDKVDAENSNQTGMTSKGVVHSATRKTATFVNDMPICSSQNNSVDLLECRRESFSSSLSENESDIVKESQNCGEMLENCVNMTKMNSSFASNEIDESQERMVLRKKRNVGSMEDLWDESVFLEDNTRRTTPVIKISFGAQGEGTVLKIPAKVKSYQSSESDAEGPEGSQFETSSKEARDKAAKKALKKAKKEARKKTLGEGAVSPSTLLGNSSPNYESSLYHRRRKRKVKHKKRHKGFDGQQEVNSKEEDIEPNVNPMMEEKPLQIHNCASNDIVGTVNNCDYDLMREKCLKQKLSISLKRLNATAYARCGDSSSSAGSDSPRSTSELSCADELPDFPRPPTDQALTAVSSCLTNDGRTMEVGDVVWGKIHGFPWWPGKVLSITIQKKDDGGAIVPQAHVAWYGSSTSSLMSCDQLSPFLETFKTRYNKKKRGPYKEAIRQATFEARKDSSDPFQGIEIVS